MASTRVYKVTGFDKVIFNGVELNQIPLTLEECRWDQIQALTQNGLIGEYYSVGDKKSIKLSTGETMDMMLVSINDGTGTYSEYYPANTIDFVSCNATSNNKNFCNWSDYDNTDYTGWAYSNVKEKLNNDIINTIPAEIRDCIKPKRHIYPIVYRSDGRTVYSIGEDKLWLPTITEINGVASDHESEYNNKFYSTLKSEYLSYRTRCTSSVRRLYDAVVRNISIEEVLNNPLHLPVHIGFRIG